MTSTDLKASDFKTEDKPLVPVWLDIILFAILCVVVAGSAVLALTKASVLLGFIILWGGAALLIAIRIGVKRAREAWS